MLIETTLGACDQGGLPYPTLLSTAWHGTVYQIWGASLPGGSLSKSLEHIRLTMTQFNSQMRCNAVQHINVEWRGPTAPETFTAAKLSSFK